MMSLIRSTPITEVADSMDALSTKKKLTATEMAVMQELKAIHHSRLLALVSAKYTGSLLDDRDRLRAAPRPLKPSETALYWAVIEELEYRERRAG
jgi:hypothetical protein